MNPDVHDLSAAYALDALDPDERRDFEAHFATCERCRSEVRGFREVTTSLASEVESPPPAGLKSLVMAGIATTEQLAPIDSSPTDSSPTDSSAGSATVTDLGERRNRRSVAIVGIAAAIVLMAVTALATWSLASRSDPIDDIIAASDVDVTQLQGDSGAVQVLWSPERNEVAMIGDGLPPLEDDEAYALWFVLDEGVAPAGLFTGDDGVVRATAEVDDVDPVGWGVTVEPDTGSEQPTGDIIYSADV